MAQRLSKAPAALLAVLLLCSPCVQGQNSNSGSSDSDYADEQSKAIDRVDELAGRLQSMRWGPEVVDALSSLGAAACRYDRELGVRVFETAYSVAAGFDFDLNEESSLQTLSGLAAAALRCHPGFRDRALTRDGAVSEVSARARLEAAMASVATDPRQAARFARGAASQFHTLPDYRQLAFVEGLWELRRQLPAAADGLFREALLGAASAGAVADLFALGNYVFGPKFALEGAVGVTPLAAGQAYLFYRVRPGLPNELANLYLGAAADRFLRRGTPLSQDPESFALAAQLASWAETNAPKQAPLLHSLLDTRAASTGTRSRLSQLMERLRPVTESEALADMEAELEAAVDERTKSRLAFALCVTRIRRGEFRRAADLLDDLRPELRRPLFDIMELKRAAASVANNNLADAAGGVASLKNSLYKVLGALNLAVAYRARSRDAENGSAAEDRDNAERALQLAVGAAESIPDRLRPHARMAIATVLAKCDRNEETLRVLELALQELNADRPDEEAEESVLSIVYYEGDGFAAKLTDDGQSRFFYLRPPNLRGAGFGQAMSYLAFSPQMDLNRLDAIASGSLDLRLRTEGLAAVAEGALARAFNTKKK